MEKNQTNNKGVTPCQAAISDMKNSFVNPAFLGLHDKFSSPDRSVQEPPRIPLLKRIRHFLENDDKKMTSNIRLGCLG